jgi:hypothetical protein
VSFKKRYGEDNWLWTPDSTMTGSSPLADTVNFWLDADYTSSFTTTTVGGYPVISTAQDRIANIAFVGDATYPPVYPTTASAGTNADIGNRPTIWFSNVINVGSQPIRNFQIGRMTSSIGAIDGKLPGDDEARAVFYVAKFHGWRTALAGYAWQYGDNAANQTYGLGGNPSGSADQESGWAHSQATLFLSRYGSTKNFTSGSEDLVSRASVTQLFYQFHEQGSGNGGISINGASAQYTYSGVTLETNVDSNGSFFFGGEVENSAVRPHWTLAEMIIIDGVPSTSDRQRIEGYLAHKWDQTDSLPSDHPYKTTPPYNGRPIPITYDITASAPEFPSIASNFTVNAYKNISVQFDRNTDQVPFSKVIKGPRNLRGRISAYSSSLG